MSLLVELTRAVGDHHHTWGFPGAGLSRNSPVARAACQSALLELSWRSPAPGGRADGCHRIRKDWRVIIWSLFAFVLIPPVGV